MASETKSIFLYGNPTDKKLEMLKQIQTKYTDKINEFIVADNKSNVFNNTDLILSLGTLFLAKK